MLHSSQLLSQAVIEATRVGLPAAKAYLDSRMIESDHPLLLESYPKLKSRWRRQIADKQNPVKYGAQIAPIWGRVSDIEGNLFKKNKPREPTRFVLIDLPGIHE